MKKMIKKIVKVKSIIYQKVKKIWEKAILLWTKIKIKKEKIIQEMKINM